MGKMLSRGIVAVALVAPPAARAEGGPQLSLGVHAGLVPLVGGTANVTWDDGYAAVEVGHGWTPLVASSTAVRGGPSLRLRDPGPLELRLQPMVGWRRVTLSRWTVGYLEAVGMLGDLVGADGDVDVDERDDLVTATLAVDAVRPLSDRVGLFGRATGGAGTDLESGSWTPELALSAGITWGPRR